MARLDQHKWTTITTADLNPMEEMYFSHEAYNDYPVVNISHDGAKMYCAWLSESYEKSEDAKKYGQVERARIPEYEEWYLAATNAGQDTFYPWSGAFPRNADGCYLANYRPKIEDYDEDGGFYTVKVDSYNPNKFGVYNLVGNATEMVISKNAVLHAGGSWMSPLDELKLNIPDNLVERKEPHPADGFRIVFTHFGRGYTNTK